MFLDHAQLIICLHYDDYGEPPRNVNIDPFCILNSPHPNTQSNLRTVVTGCVNKKCKDTPALLLNSKSTLCLRTLSREICI